MDDIAADLPPIATRPTTAQPCDRGELTAEDFVRAVGCLTDRQRLNFAGWASGQPNMTSTDVDWGRLYIKGNYQLVLDAVLAFNSLKHDDTVSDGEGEWFFDFANAYGWPQWEAAEAHIIAMVIALQRHDDAALSLLAAAFDEVGFPVGYNGASK